MDDLSTRILVEQIIAARVVPLEEGQRQAAAILARFDMVLNGVEESKMEGLTGKVDRHDEVIIGWNGKLSEITGGLKAAVFSFKVLLGVITAIHIGFDYWLVFHGK